MVVTDDFKFVTARAYPKMLLIQPAINGDTITLSSPDSQDISLSFTHLRTMKPVDVSLWNRPVQTVDCGNEVATWLSRFILEQETGMRLVFHPNEKPTRNFKPGNTKYDKLAPIDSVLYKTLN